MSESRAVSITATRLRIVDDHPDRACLRLCANNFERQREEIAVVYRSFPERDEFAAELVRRWNAAPAMLKALEEIRDYCADREDVNDGDSGPIPNDFMRLARIARDAIAAAGAP